MSVTEGRILNRTLINLNSRTWLRYWTAQGQAEETAKTKRGKKELVGAEAGCSTRLGSAAARAARRLRASDAGTCRGPRGRPSVHTLGSGTAEPRGDAGHCADSSARMTRGHPEGGTTERSILQSRKWGFPSVKLHALE